MPTTICVSVGLLLALTTLNYAISQNITLIPVGDRLFPVSTTTEKPRLTVKTEVLSYHSYATYKPGSVLSGLPIPSINSISKPVPISSTADLPERMSDNSFVSKQLGVAVDEVKIQSITRVPIILPPINHATSAHYYPLYAAAGQLGGIAQPTGTGQQAVPQNIPFYQVAGLVPQKQYGIPATAQHNGMGRYPFPPQKWVPNQSSKPDKMPSVSISGLAGKAAITGNAQQHLSVYGNGLAFRGFVNGDNLNWPTGNNRPDRAILSSNVNVKPSGLTAADQEIMEYAGCQ